MATTLATASPPHRNAGAACEDHPLPAPLQRQHALDGADLGTVPRSPASNPRKAERMLASPPAGRGRAVIEKPSALTPDEMALMSKHPEYGLQALNVMAGLKQELVDIVLHHHEYFDGSGYPHGLRGSEISDPVRIVTICDIFGALLERRAYKPPLPPETAYQILLDMSGKLDRDLVREFGFAKVLRFNPTG